MVSKGSSEEVLAVEDKQLPDYELVVIISPEVADGKVGATIDNITGNITQFITGRGGVISDVEQWGRRKLAYPIKHFLEGDYILARFKLKPGFTKELKASLEISEEVLRHLLIRVE